jgi:hypothetical protein
MINHDDDDVKWLFLRHEFETQRLNGTPAMSNSVSAIQDDPLELVKRTDRLLFGSQRVYGIDRCGTAGGNKASNG